MSKLYNQKIKIKRGIYILSIFITILSIMFILLEIKPEAYKNMFLIPLSYLISLIIFNDLYLNSTYKHGVVFYSINIVMFIKYVITPISIIVSGEYGGPGPEPSNYSYNLAYMLMVYEILSVFIVINIISIKNKNKFQKNNVCNELEVCNVNILNKNVIIIIFSLLAAIWIAPYISAIIGRSFLSTLFNQERSKIIPPDSVIIINRIVNIAFSVFIIEYLKKRYYKVKKMKYIWLTLVVFTSIILISPGNSRWNVLYWAIIAIIMLHDIYGKRAIVPIYIISILCVIGLISISIMKFSWMFSGSDNSLIEVMKIMIGQFQDYFSGVRPVAQAIEMKNSFVNVFTAETVLNDLGRVIPGLSSLINASNQTNVIFNNYIFSNSNLVVLIIPMIGYGYIYLGFLGAPLWIALFVGIAMKYDYIVMSTKKIEYKILYMFAGLNLSMVFGYHPQLIYSFYTYTFIPLIILFKINNIIRLKKEYN